MWRTSENLGKYYNGTNLKLSILRMDLKERIFFNFCYKNRTKILGKLIHFYKRIVDTHKFETPGKRVIIYAAGTFGKEIYERLQCVPNIKIVGWADINHKKYKELGYQVESLNNVLKFDYEFLIVAIKNKQTVKAVRGLLLEIGVNPEKIIDGEEFLQRYFDK